jgi:hypothetical protein
LGIDAGNYPMETWPVKNDAHHRTVTILFVRVRNGV